MVLYAAVGRPPRCRIALTMQGVLRTDDPYHRWRITTQLEAFALGSRISRIELMQKGISGASTYRVTTMSSDLVLKIVDAGSPEQLLKRAARESWFYREASGFVSLQLPAVLGNTAGDSGYCLCLKAYRAAPSLHLWDLAYWEDVVRELATFHASFWQATYRFPEFAVLQTSQWRCDDPTLQAAMAAWRNLLDPVPLVDDRSGNPLSGIEHALLTIDMLTSEYTGFPQTLCHGDCHAGNLVVDEPHRRVWLDWQEVRIGAGPEDLSFFFQRARADGVVVPEDAAITCYHRALETTVGESIDYQELRRMIFMSELRSLLLLWPPFLTGVSVQRRCDVLRRIRQLDFELRVA